MPSVDHYVDQVMAELLSAAADATEMKLIERAFFVDNEARVRQTLVDLADHAAAHREQIVEGLIAGDDNVEAECCGHCPLLEEFDDRRGCGATCMHHSLKEPQVDEETMYRDPPPEWCPLRVQPMRISIKEGE